MDITYLGSAGFLVKRGKHAILTGGLVSNPGLLEIATNGRIGPDTAWIQHQLGRAQMRRDLLDVDAILVGHSHYDHLMDIPYIAEHFAIRATIWGSPSMGHILNGDSALRPIGRASIADGKVHRVMVIDSTLVGSRFKTGSWFYAGDSTIRFMALESEHPANFAGYTLAPGLVTQDRTRLPRRVNGWRLGETYAYLVEFLHADKSVAFRVYFSDAPARPPLGEPPQSLLSDTARVSVAIICAGNFEQVPFYPADLIQTLRPQQILLGHWEDFFRAQWKEPKVIPLLNTAALSTRLDSLLPDSTSWVTPAIYSTMHYCSCR